LGLEDYVIDNVLIRTKGMGMVIALGRGQ
jgi:hypothetical protein